MFGVSGAAGFTRNLFETGMVRRQGHRGRSILSDIRHSRAQLHGYWADRGLRKFGVVVWF